MTYSKILCWLVFVVCLKRGFLHVTLTVLGHAARLLCLCAFLLTRQRRHGKISLHTHAGRNVRWFYDMVVGFFHLWTALVMKGLCLLKNHKFIEIGEAIEVILSFSYSHS